MGETPKIMDSTMRVSRYKMFSVECRGREIRLMEVGNGGIPRVCLINHDDDVNRHLGCFDVEDPVKFMELWLCLKELVSPI